MEFDFAEVLLQVMDRNASDLHLTAGSPPMIRQHGKLHALDYPVLTPQTTREVVYSILTNDQRQRLETDWQIDFAYSIPGKARFRVNAYMQRASLSAAFRLVMLGALANSYTTMLYPCLSAHGLARWGIAAFAAGSGVAAAAFWWLTPALGLAGAGLAYALAQLAAVLVIVLAYRTRFGFTASAILLPQPEIRYAYSGEAGYMFPRADGILLGGTYERDQWEAAPQPEAIARIIERHRALMARLRCTT